MSRIDTIFSDGKKKIIPFIVAGYPSLDETESILLALDAAGADVIEIGIPFSDPIADGPVIAAAMHKALEMGYTPSDAIGALSRVRSQIKAGVVAMVSHSIVRKSGGRAFIKRLAESGFDGVIIPDIDGDEAQIMGSYCNEIDIAFIMLVAPTTPIERVKTQTDCSSGFLYVLARTGLTGEQAEMPDISERIHKIRTVTDLPLAVGFGISNAEHVKSVHKVADAAIIGSALVRRLGEAKDPVTSATQFLKEILQ